MYSTASGEGCCRHHVAALQHLLVVGFLFSVQQNVYENGGKYQITTVSMAIDYVYLLYVYRFGFIYIFICMYAHKIIPLFSQSSSCFSFNFKMKTKK